MKELPSPDENAPGPKRGKPDQSGPQHDYVAENVVSAGDPIGTEIGGEGEGVLFKLTYDDIREFMTMDVRITRHFDVSPEDLAIAKQDCFAMATTAIDALSTPRGPRPSVEHVKATDEQIEAVLEILSAALRKLGPEIVLDAVNQLLGDPDYQRKLRELADSYGFPEEKNKWRRLSPFTAFKAAIGVLFMAGLIVPFVGDTGYQIAFQNTVQDGTLAAALVPLIRR